MISSVVRDSFTSLNTVVHVKAHYRGEGTSPEHFIYFKCKWMDQSKGVDFQLDLCYLCIVHVKSPWSWLGTPEYVFPN